MTREPPVLHTGRLRLEPTRVDHAAAVWNAIERSLPELNKRMTWAASSSPSGVADYAQRMEAGWRDWTNWDFVIHLGDKVAGTVGLNRFDELWRTCNLGYWIRSDLAGQGLATEAGAAVVSFAFDQLGLHRLELTVAVDNVASQRVAEKIGFQREGTKRQAYIVDGRAVDAFAYGLLASDPRP